MNGSPADYIFSAHTIPLASRNETIDEVRTMLFVRIEEFETIDYIYVLDDKKLVGVLSVHELLLADEGSVIEQVMSKPVAFVHDTTDPEHIAHLALAQSIKAVPVVDSDDNFIGVVPADAILRVLRESYTEDLMRFAGVSYSAAEKLSNFTVWQHFISRLPWLILGLGGGILAAFVVERFEHILASEILLAAFIPAIVYIADAVGSQTQMVYVRSLMHRNAQPLVKVAARELLISIIVGIVLALLIFVFGLWWHQHHALPLALALSVLATVIFSVLVAILLPWFFQKIGKDPAVATGPLATVIRDISSLIIYFLIASIFIF